MSTGASYRGQVAWVSEAEETGQVLRAVFRTPNELVLEIEHNGKTYIVDLQPTARSYAGTRWRGKISNPGGFGGTCDARVFRDDEDLFLFGEWREGGKAWIWWSELEREPAP